MALSAGSTALITGAASGVGFATATMCRNKGMHLALVDIDSTNLQKAKEILSAMDKSLKTEFYILDVSNRGAWTEIARQVTSTFGEVDLLVLNAGKGYKAKGQEDGGRLKPWTDTEYWHKTFGTNVFGVLNGIDALLPLMLSSKKTPKSIVITGSKQGITNPPGGANPAYNSSKAAIKLLTEHLAHDLRSDPSTAHISVHLLIPGWTYTGQGPVSNEEVKKPAGAWYPSQVAAELQRALENGSFYVLCSDDETDRALDEARMKWATDDIVENRPALSRWDDGWKKRSDDWIQAEASQRRGA